MGSARRITKVLRIHPLGPMNVCTNVCTTLFNSYSIFQSGPKWWTNQHQSHAINVAKNW